MIFNDSWAARAANPTEIMQMQGSHCIFHESGAARASHPIAQNVWKCLIFNDSWVAKAAHLTAETMQMYEIITFSMNQGPPTPPHTIARAMTMHGNLQFFYSFFGR